MNVALIQFKKDIREILALNEYEKGRETKFASQ